MIHCCGLNQCLYIYAKGENRSQVTVQHGKLTSARSADQKKYWRDALTRLEWVLA